MRRQEITDEVALAEEIEHLVIEAQENDVPDHDIRDVLDSMKNFVSE